MGGVGLCAVISIVMLAGVFISFILCGKMDTTKAEDPEKLKESEDKGKEYLDNH